MPTCQVIDRVAVCRGLCHHRKKNRQFLKVLQG